MKIKNRVRRRWSRSVVMVDRALMEARGTIPQRGGNGRNENLEGVVGGWKHGGAYSSHLKCSYRDLPTATGSGIKRTVGFSQWRRYVRRLVEVRRRSLRWSTTDYDAVRTAVRQYSISRFSIFLVVSWFAWFGIFRFGPCIHAWIGFIFGPCLLGIFCYKYVSLICLQVCQS